LPIANFEILARIYQLAIGNRKLAIRVVCG
jgi:hypothetical protein